MIEQSECNRCHEDFEIRGGCYPSEFCDSCAHLVVKELQFKIQGLELRCVHLEDALRASATVPNPVEEKLRDLLKTLRDKIWTLELDLNNEKISNERLISEVKKLQLSYTSLLLEPPSDTEKYDLLKSLTH